MRLEELIRLPEKIPCDKRIHALVGAALTSALLVSSVPMLHTLVILAAVAWIVEWYQLLTKTGHYDNYDAIAVVIGGLLVAAPYLVR